MKLKIYYNNIIFLLFSFVMGNITAQVGIGTTTPEGMLDIESTSSGFVFPKVSLTSRASESPVTNPNGGGIVEGTVVYNTNTTQSGSNDVYPGIYVWDGNEWIAQYIKEDNQKFEQSTLEFRVPKNGSFRDVPGLANGSSFTPKYSGTYRIEANFNFGAGELNPPETPNNVRMATQEGYFRFNFNGSNYDIYTHAYSINNQLIGAGTGYEAFRHDSSLILYENLRAGVTYSFGLRVDVMVDNEFQNEAYAGIDLPCTVEFIYLEE